jgi:hypothetical protein
VDLQRDRELVRCVDQTSGKLRLEVGLANAFVQVAAVAQDDRGRSGRYRNAYQ